MSDPQNSAAAGTTAAPAYTPREMMAIAAGRFIKDGDVLFAGTGVAMLAATVAKRIHAPQALPRHLAVVRPVQTPAAQMSVAAHEHEIFDGITRQHFQRRRHQRHAPRALARFHAAVRRAFQQDFS